MRKIAIYPGSFDPVTNGHVDIAQRGLKIFDKIIVAILHNPVKEFLFSVEERVEMLESSFEAYPNIKVETFEGLLVEYASKKGSIAILRGIRPSS
jgi:pantetheine-phosphate adenylyltransferase